MASPTIVLIKNIEGRNAMINTIIPILRKFRKCFSRRAGFNNFVTVILGVLLCGGRKVVTNFTRFGRLESRYTMLYKFLSRSPWSVQKVVETLVDILLALLPLKREADGRIPLVVSEDSTFAEKSGKKMPGVGFFLDTSNGGKGSKWVRAHCWMVLTAMLDIPGLGWVHFPLRCGMFVRKSTAEAAGETFVPMLEVALGLIRLTLPAERFSLTVVADSFFAKKTFGGALLEWGHHLVTRLKKNSVGYTPPVAQEKRKRGRPRKYGEKVKLLSLLDDQSAAKKMTINVYGKDEIVTMACGVFVVKWLARPVLVMAVGGKKGKALFMSTDVTMDPMRALELYAARFGIETMFRDLKQDLGFTEYQVRNRMSTERMTFLTLAAYSVMRIIVLKDSKLRDEVTKSLSDPWRAQMPKYSNATVIKVTAGILFTAGILCMVGGKLKLSKNAQTMMVHESAKGESSKL